MFIFLVSALCVRFIKRRWLVFLASALLTFILWIIEVAAAIWATEYASMDSDSALKVIGYIIPMLIISQMAVCILLKTPVRKEPEPEK